MAYVPFAFRRGMDEKEHVPLETKIGRDYWKRRKNRPLENFEAQARINVGKAQKNMPENYMFDKKEW